MDVLSLSATLTLDTAPYEQGLQQAEDAMAAFGRQSEAAAANASAVLSTLAHRLQEVTAALRGADRAAQSLMRTVQGLHSALPGRISL